MRRVPLYMALLGAGIGSLSAQESRGSIRGKIQDTSGAVVRGRLADMAVGGWQIGPMYQLGSGEPYTWGNIIFTGDPHSIELPSSQRTVDRWFNTDAGFERSSAKQLGSNLRTFPMRSANLRSLIQGMPPELHKGDPSLPWRLGVIESRGE